MYFLPPEAYQPLAQQYFEEITENLNSVFSETLDAKIEHIGSSSIPETLSKGDLDIYVAVPFEQMNDAIAAIESLGFHIKQDTLRTEELCPFESHDYPLDVGIQLIAQGSRFEFFITFRDWMRSHPEDVQAYNEMKQGCTGMTPEAYRKVKSEFIESILSKTNGSPPTRG